MVDWAPPAGARFRPIIAFVFDAGTLPDTALLHLGDDELDDYAFLHPREAAARLPHNVAPRVDAALTARRTTRTVYLPGPNRT